jgi:hypothetical protein
MSTFGFAKFARMSFYFKRFILKDHGQSQALDRGNTTSTLFEKFI